MSQPFTPIEWRFWPKVKIQEGCWIWIGCKKTGGYGNVNVDGRLQVAHRVAYELMVGPIPKELDLDHLCRNRACVNPAHLEPVTHRENVLRGEGVAAKYARRTKCNAGHDLNGWNAYINPTSGARICRKCNSQYQKEYRANRSQK